KRERTKRVHGSSRRHLSDRPPWRTCATIKDQSGLMLAFWMTSRQRSVSRLRNAAVSAGDSPSGVIARSLKRLATSSSLSAAAIACDTLSTIAGAVFGGATRANQLAE